MTGVPSRALYRQPHARWDTVAPLVPAPPPGALAATKLGEIGGTGQSTRGADAWREVKVGVVVRGEHLLSKNGRGLISQARFVARLGNYDAFKKGLTEVLTLERAWECEQLVFLGDGAPWVWASADEVCHGAVQILDYPHAVQHANAAAQVLFAPGDGCADLFVGTIERMLWEGRVEDIVHDLEACAFTARGRSRQALVDLAADYENRGLIRIFVFQDQGSESYLEKLRAGQSRTLELLADYFAGHMALGNLPKMDAFALALMFIGMLLGLGMIGPHSYERSLADFDAAARFATQTFLSGITHSQPVETQR